MVKQGNLPTLQAAVIKGDQIIWSKAFGDNADLSFSEFNKLYAKRCLTGEGTRLEYRWF